MRLENCIKSMFFGGWIGGWMDIKAVVRITYGSQKGRKERKKKRKEGKKGKKRKKEGKRNK